MNSDGGGGLPTHGGASSPVAVHGQTGTLIDGMIVGGSSCFKYSRAGALHLRHDAARAIIGGVRIGVLMETSPGPWGACVSSCICLGCTSRRSRRRAGGGRAGIGRAVAVANRVMISRGRTRRDVCRNLFVARRVEQCELEMQRTMGCPATFVRVNDMPI